MEVRQALFPATLAMSDSILAPDAFQPDKWDMSGYILRVSEGAYRRGPRKADPNKKKKRKAQARARRVTRNNR